MAIRDLPRHPPEPHPPVRAETTPAVDGENSAAGDAAGDGGDGAPHRADEPSPEPGERPAAWSPPAGGTVVTSTVITSTTVPSAAARPSDRPLGPPRPPDSTSQGPKPVFRPAHTPPLPPEPPKPPEPAGASGTPDLAKPAAPSRAPHSSEPPDAARPSLLPPPVPPVPPPFGTAPASPAPAGPPPAAPVPADPPPAATDAGTGTGAPAGTTAPPAPPASPAPTASSPAAPATAPQPTGAPGPTDRDPAPAALVSRYQHLPMRAPTAVSTVAPGLEGAQGAPQHGNSPARRAGRSLRRLVSSTVRRGAGATALESRVGQPIPLGRHVAVSSIRGGAGKSTVAALLGLTYAQHRRDAVLTLEADPALGTLPIRMGAESVRWTCGDVARIVAPSMQLTDITGYLVQLPQGGWLLPGSQGAVGVRLELEEYATVMTALRGLFGMCVVDCETLPAELARAALHAAHARVLVAPATVEGVASTRSVLDWMIGLPRPMLPSTVVVLTQSTPHMTLDVAKATRHLSIAGATVRTLPYDRHLAAGGAVLASHLSRGTRQAATHLAADLLDRALRTPR